MIDPGRVVDQGEPQIWVSDHGIRVVTRRVFDDLHDRVSPYNVMSRDGAPVAVFGQRQREMFLGRFGEGLKVRHHTLGPIIRVKNFFMQKKPPKSPPKLKLVKPSPSDVIAPPRRLSEHGRDLWNVIQTEYNVTDSGGIEILMQACAALDRAEEMAEQINNDGPIVVTKGAPREHPLLKTELANRAFCVRCLQKLGLNFEVVKAVGGARCHASIAHCLHQFFQVLGKRHDGLGHIGLVISRTVTYAVVR